MAALSVGLLAVLAWVLSPWVVDELERSEARRVDPDDLSTLNTEEELRAWVVTHPERVSLVVWSLDADGTLLPAVSPLSHRADQLRPAGTVAFLPWVLAWAQNVEVQSPGVELDAWERWWLPGAPEAYGHLDAVRRAGATPGEAGRAVSEQDVVDALVRSADPAAADWLRASVPQEGLQAVYEELALRHRELPPSLLGVALAGPRSDAVDVRITEQEPAELQALAERYAADAAFREAERTWRSAAGQERSWTASERSIALWPHTSADDVARVLAHLASTRGQRGARARVVDMMRWPMEHPANAEGYEVFGGMSFIAPGVAVEAAFARSVGRPVRVVVLMIEDIDYRPWLTLSRSYAHQQWVRALLDDPLEAADLAHEWGEGPGRPR